MNERESGGGKGEKLKEGRVESGLEKRGGGGGGGEEEGWGREGER